MSSRSSVHWQEQGQEPDYRFSLANERTMLAWVRTALALLAGAMLFHQFGERFRPEWAVCGLAIGLAATSGILGAFSYVRWKANEIAMRHDRPLPHTSQLLAVSVVIVSLAAAVTLLLLYQ